MAPPGAGSALLTARPLAVPGRPRRLPMLAGRSSGASLPRGAQSLCSEPSASVLSTLDGDRRSLGLWHCFPSLAWQYRGSFPLTLFLKLASSFLSCFDRFICLPHVSAVFLIAIYQVRYPKPRRRAEELQFNLISTLILGWN